MSTTRRQILGGGVLAAAAALPEPARAADESKAPAASNVPSPGERPPAPPPGVRVGNPRARVPVSILIDDSTCLVNVAHFCIPQFAEVSPKQYTQDWRKLPREIPDAFVRKFMEWCRDHGVKGKYSIVPYPCSVGWVDRRMPGWTRKELEDSVTLVRDFVARDWDIHPEMVTHTYAIDPRNGRPYEERSLAFMENWGFSVGKSVDQLTEYLAYALRPLKNAGLLCEGITTPGGFGTKVMPALAQATLAACRDVYRTEIPHYFRDLYTDGRSVVPQVLYAAGLASNDPRCVVQTIGCTGDWFGGWDGLERGKADQFITADGKGGRMPEVIKRGEPAVMVCHWPGMYCNGDEYGFGVFQEVVRRLHATYDHLVWMKTSELARYWAARELTRIERAGRQVTFAAPFAAPAFTVEIDGARPGGAPQIVAGAVRSRLREVQGPRRLDSGTWTRTAGGITVCFDLAKGASRLELV